MKKIFKILCFAAVVLFILYGCVKKTDNSKTDTTKTTAQSGTSISEKNVSSQYSETTGSSTAPITSAVTKKKSAEPVYKKGILIVNKKYALPSGYNPGVNPEAQNAFNKMSAAASKENIRLYIVSGFRSYSTQKSIYNNYVARDGKDEADRYSARPGHSEHQTGLAFDVNSLSQSFENTPEGKWLAENCHKYGFIIRYPKGKENVTGYMYEPWHVRYLGKENAEKVFNSGKTLEEYLGVTSVYADR